MLYPLQNRIPEPEGFPDPVLTLGNFAGNPNGNGIHFIMGLDRKGDIGDLHYRIRCALKDSFDAEVELPSLGNPWRL